MSEEKKQAEKKEKSDREINGIAFKEVVSRVEAKYNITLDDKDQKDNREHDALRRKIRSVCRMISIQATDKKQRP